MDGFREGGFPQLLFARKSVMAREFLLEIDTSLATTTSGLRTNLLLQGSPLPKTPHSIFPSMEWQRHDYVR